MSIYPGGKNADGVYQRIINLMPPHDVYIEPFLGSGAIMRLKRPAGFSYGLDRSPEAIRKFLKLLPSSEMARGGCYPSENMGVSPSDVASRWRSGRRAAVSPPLTIWDPNCPAWAVAWAKRRRPVSSADIFRPGDARSIGRVWVGAALDFLGSYKVGGRELVYCDPPYIRHTRRGAGDLYDFEMTDSDHAALLAVLVKLPCMVIISGYASRLYGRALRSWRRVDYQAMTRRGVAVESLWLNYPESVELHQYDFLGSDFRERERIKRKRLRWVARLRGMPLLERRALLAAMREAQW